MFTCGEKRSTVQSRRGWGVSSRLKCTERGGRGDERGWRGRTGEAKDDDDVQQKSNEETESKKTVDCRGAKDLKRGCVAKKNKGGAPH